MVDRLVDPPDEEGSENPSRGSDPDWTWTREKGSEREREREQTGITYHLSGDLTHVKGVSRFQPRISRSFTPEPSVVKSATHPGSSLDVWMSLHRTSGVRGPAVTAMS